MPFVNQDLKASEGVAGLSIAMRGLIDAAIDADMRRMTRASSSKGDQRSSALAQRTPSAEDRFLALPARS
jgi:hypothetical protein